jgi:hypothetical protein
MIRGFQPRDVRHAAHSFARAGACARLGACSLLVGLTVACGRDASNAVVSAASIGLTASASPTIAVGQTVTLYAHASDAKGTPIPAFRGVTWSSSNPTVASVAKADTTGVVTGLAVGETVISASVRAGLVAQMTVRVGSIPVIGISPTAAVFTAYRNSSVTAQQLVIRNEGSGALTSLAATTSAPWLQASFVDGVTSAAPAATLRLLPSMTGLAEGTYNATVTVTSAVAGVVPRTVPVTLQIAPALVPFRIDAVTSPTQDGSAGRPVAQPPTVVVRAVDDTPVAGVAVTFAVSGGGTIVPSGVVTTDANGIAALTSWTLGSQPGASQSVTASSPGLAGNPLTFRATALSASKIVKVSGDNQSAVLGRPLPQPVIVRVLDPNNVPVPNANVTFSAAAGGSVSTTTAATDAGGQASVEWTLGAAAGAQQLTATLVTPLGAPMVTFTATATGATGITIVSGDGQQAAAGAELPAPVRVRVTGANATPVVGETVTFAPASGSGTATPTTIKTDANGEASARWTLGPSIGAKTLVASINPTSGVTSVSFSATATDPPPGGIVIVAGDNQSGRVDLALPQQIVARVVTTIGTGIPGATVTFAPASGSGQSFSPTSATTDSNGEVRTTWTLGPELGPYTATVSSPGLPSTIARATAALPPIGVGVFAGGAAKVPGGAAFGSSDQAVVTYAGPASGEVALGAGGGFTSPRLPPGAYTLSITSKSGAFPPTPVYGVTLTGGQVTSVGTIPVAYAGAGSVVFTLHACPLVGDANAVAKVRLYAGVNGDQGGALVYTWTIPFGSDWTELGVSYGIYTMTITSEHKTDATKTCAVYRAPLQHSFTTTGRTTTLPIIDLNP